MAELVPPDGACEPTTLPGSRAAYTVHIGPHGDIHLAYQAATARLRARDLEPGPNPREVYLLESEHDGDPSKSETEPIWSLA